MTLSPITPKPGQRIPAPDDFPLHWPDPTQARHLWMLDRMHFPDPVPPVLASLSADLVAAPFNYAAERYALPVRLSTLCLNTYLYLGFRPAGAPPDFILRALNRLKQIAPGVVEALMANVAADLTQKYLTAMEPVLGRLLECWEQEWQPELAQSLADWESFDLSTATMPQLIAHWEASLSRLKRAWEIHWLVVLPSFLALSLFDELYRELFESDETLGGYRLLQGIDNKFLEADRALWQLSRQAFTLPTVRHVLERCTAEEVMPALQGSPEGEIFLSELRRYLNTYGQRSSHAEGLTHLSWIEDPTPVLASLKDYATQPDRDLEAELRVQAAEREQLTAQARKRLAGSPLALERLERSLRAAQAAAFLHEEHNYWIDQRCQYHLRRIILEFGWRFAAIGLLPKPADVFLLTHHELRALAVEPTANSYETLVRERQAEMERFRAVSPPRFVGTTPWLPPPDEPFGRSLEKVFGGPPVPTSPPVPASTGSAQGHPASPGVARGRACVVRTLNEASRLKLGDVLVVEATTPAWTSLFASASAVVTELGGVLSHAAVVAREYRLPAVVGVRLAMTTLRDGQMLEVDGNAGVVRVLD